jgi:hypothetical protein
VNLAPPKRGDVIHFAYRTGSPRIDTFSYIELQNVIDNSVRYRIKETVREGRTLTITSINHNPKNDSKYARRRSLWKGTRNQLREAIAQLNGTQGVRVWEYNDAALIVFGQFMADWNVRLGAQRQFPTSRTQVLGKWQIAPPSHKITDAVPQSLRADLKMLWDDFILVAAQRVGVSDGVGSGADPDYSGKCVVVFAPGPQSFDLIVSKWGFGDSLKHSHHFYQWQARTQSFTGLVNVDDYTDDDGITLFVQR